MTIPLFDVQAGFGGHKGGVREVFPPEAVVAEMDRLRIDRAIVRILPDELDKDVPGTTAMLYAACEASGRRLLPCPALIPSAGGDFPPEAEQAAQAVQRGAAAAILRPSIDYWSLEDWSGGKLLAAMEDRRLPALCLPRLVPLADAARLAVAHPRLPIIVAEVEYRMFRMLVGLLESRPNVYLSIGPTFSVHEGIEHIVSRLGPQRLLFGTGIPRSEPMMAVTQLLYADLSDEHKRLIGSENLNRLLGGIRR